MSSKALKLFLSILAIIVCIHVFSNSVFAASSAGSNSARPALKITNSANITSGKGSSTLSAFPSSGSFGKAFSVDIVIDGHSDTFNAAEAIVSISKSLFVQDLILGNCNFSFINTPSVVNPSFEGAILGGSSKKCTVFTLKLVPVKKEVGTISFSKATVRRYGDAANVLASVKNGSYMLTAALKKPALTTTVIPKGDRYTVLLKIISIDNAPVKSATVSIKSVASRDALKSVTDTSGTARFSNIKKGIYEVNVSNHKEQTILNVSGNNHILTLSIKVKEQSIVPKLVGVAILLLIGLPSVVLFIRWLKRRTSIN